MQHAVLLAATLSASLAAQTWFSPVTAGTAQGNVNNTLPFAQSTYQYQQVHSASSFAPSVNGVVNRIRFRAKAQTTAGTADLELWMARSPNDAANASATFASNETNPINVFVRKMVNMPSVGPGQWGAPDLAFDVPFVALPIHHISWRVLIHSNNSTPYTLDCFSDWRFGTPTAYGGCQHPMGTQNATQNVTYRSPGNDWNLNGYSYVPNVAMPGVAMVGASNSTWGSVPLPFDMTAIGAPGCQLVNDPAIMLPGTTLANATGFLGLVVRTPRDPSWIGLTIYTQFAFVDAGANPLGIFTSRGLVNSPIPAPVEITRIYASSVTALQGTVGPDFALPVGLN
jgi:hypothetical protein